MNPNREFVSGYLIHDLNTPSLIDVMTENFGLDIQINDEGDGVIFKGEPHDFNWFDTFAEEFVSRLSDDEIDAIYNEIK